MLYDYELGHENRRKNCIETIHSLDASFCVQSRWPEPTRTTFGSFEFFCAISARMDRIAPQILHFCSVFIARELNNTSTPTLYIFYSTSNEKKIIIDIPTYINIYLYIHVIHWRVVVPIKYHHIVHIGRKTFFSFLFLIQNYYINKPKIKKKKNEVRFISFSFRFFQLSPFIFLASKCQSEESLVFKLSFWIENGSRWSFRVGLKSGRDKSDAD